MFLFRVVDILIPKNIVKQNSDILLLVILIELWLRIFVRVMFIQNYSVRSSITISPAENKITISTSFLILDYNLHLYFYLYLCQLSTHLFSSYSIYPIFYSSTNHLEASAALSAVCKIVNADMIPAVINDVSTAFTRTIVFRTCRASELTSSDGSDRKSVV